MNHDSNKTKTQSAAPGGCEVADVPNGATDGKPPVDAVAPGHSGSIVFEAPFSVSLAGLMAEISASAYEHSTIHSTYTGAAAYLFSIEPWANALVIAFRGSKCIRDFVQDGEFWQEELSWLSGGREVLVHHGFLEDFDSLRAELIEAVRAHLKRNPNLKLFATGHSLGGALAQLAALELKRQGLDCTAVYTFGSPRVGNGAFADAYNLFHKYITYNLVNAADPVPLLPPLLSGYRDAGREIFLPPSGQFVVDPNIGCELWSDVLGAFDTWRKHKLAFLPNHFIRSYQEKIKALP